MSTWQTTLEALLNQRRPRRLKAMGEAASTWARRLCTDDKAFLLVQDLPADLVVISLPEVKPEQIGLLRDRCPWLVALTTSPGDPDFNAFLGLGFERIFQSAGNQISLYSHDIATYKRVPDWLNPKYWAHPERWEP
jgi:Family of unknown function (DUF6231)